MFGKLRIIQFNGGHVAQENEDAGKLQEVPNIKSFMPLYLGDALGLYFEKSDEKTEAILKDVLTEGICSL